MPFFGDGYLALRLQKEKKNRKKKTYLSVAALQGF